MKSIPERFFASAARFPDKAAFEYFSDGWRTLSYRETASAVVSLLGRLQEGGLKKGDRVFLSAKNSPFWCISYLALSSAGAVGVPVDPELTAPEMRNLMTDAGVSLVLHDGYTEAKVAEAAAGLAAGRLDISALPVPEGPACEVPGLEDGPGPDDTASIIYTSGTTGSPKGVVLTHGNFCSDAEALAGAGIISQDDNIISILPLHHTYPFMSTFLVPLFEGATVTYPKGLKGSDLLDAVREREATILVGVPQLLELFRNRILQGFSRVPVLSAVFPIVLRAMSFVRRRFDLNPGRYVFASVHRRFGGRFRFFASGGARLDPRVMQDLEALGFTVLEGYGLTETSPVVTFNPPEKRKPGSAGRPLRNVEIRISNDGEVLIRGPMVMKGYYKNPEETEKAIRDGWLHTGDLGYMDDGYLYITGRTKEVIVLSSGKNIYPEDVERHYQGIGLIKEICVVGTGEGLSAVVVPDVELAKEMKVGNIQEHLKWEINAVSMKLPPYMRLKGFVLSPEPLPRTPLGKLRRFMVKRLIEEGQGRKDKGVDESLLEDGIASKVVSSLREVMGRDVAVGRGDSLELDIGLDSLKRIELVVALERNLGVKLYDGFTLDVQTVGELVEKARKAVEEGGTKRQQDVRGLLDVTEEERRAAEGLLSQGLYERMLLLVMTFALRLFSRIYFRVRITGVENIPEPPFIIAPNHSSYLDSFLLAANLPFRVFRILYFQGASKYFEGPFMRWFSHFAHVIPIDPDTSLLSALRISAHVLRQKKALCIFPEGGRSFTGGVMEFKQGVGILALELGVPVVPVHIGGTFRSMPRGSRFPRPVRVEIRLGRPLPPAADRNAQAFAGRVREEVLRLAP